MAVFLSPVGGVAAQFFDNSGNVLTGGKLYTYSAGTTTPVAAYTSSLGNVAWSNPIVLDAAGRVSGSGEIWLTDGVIYKFVVKDSNDVLIATYDNITGINSNALAFTSTQEIFIATAGQTVFTLASPYQPATNSLSVFVDGVNQYGPGALYSYVETDQNTVTFNNGLHVGASVKFTTTQQQGAGAVNASQVGYTPGGTGANTTTVQTKLRTYIDAQDYIATPGASAALDQAGVQAAVNYANTLGGAVVRVRPPISTSWNIQSLTVPVGVMIEDLRRMATNNIFIYGVGGDTEYILAGTSVSGGEGPSYVLVNNAVSGDRTSSIVSRYGNTGIGGSANCYMHMGVWDNPNWWPEFDMITSGASGYRSNFRAGYGTAAVNAAYSGAQYYVAGKAFVVNRPPGFTKSGEALVVGDTVSTLTTEFKIADTIAALRFCYADATSMWSWLASYPSTGQLTLYDHDTSSNRLVFSTGVTTHLGRFETTTAKLTPTTVASLPSAATVGAGGKAFVSDANSTTFASIVAGGGSNNVPVYSDGTNWRIG